MRTTRAQRRAEAEGATDIHVDPEVFPDAEIASAESIESTNTNARTPLKPVTVNSVEEVQQAEEKVMPAKKGKKAGAKGKPKGRGRKAKQNESGEEPNSAAQVDIAEDDAAEPMLPEVIEDERRAAPSPASDATEEDLKQTLAVDEIAPEPIETARSPSPAVRLTRRQLAIAAAEAALTGERDSSPESTAVDEGDVELDSENVPLQIEEMVQEPQAQIENSAVAEVQDTSDDARSDAVKSPKSMKSTLLGALETQARQENQSRSPARSPKMESSIEALDALDDAIDEINNAIPNVSPGKSKTGLRTRVNGHTPATSNSANDQPFAAQKLSRTPGQVQTTKKIATVNSPVRKAVTTGLNRSQSTKVASTVAKRDPSGHVKPKSHAEIVDYLASKRRPVSVSFPTPPPVAKSAKAPTKAAFTLPGEAVAAKLKAAREARLAREATAKGTREEKKPNTFKARTVPKTVTVASAPSCAAKPTAANRARLSIAGSPAPVEKADKQIKRTSVVIPNKRLSSLTTTVKPRPASQNMAGVSIPPPPQPTVKPAPKARITSLTIQPKPRVPSVSKPAAAVKPVVTPTDVASQKIKGKEIFNRDKLEKEELEHQRREKEEAAKKARADAAERGRIASREWAEKQKKRLAEKMAAQKEGTTMTT